MWSNTYIWMIYYIKDKVSAMFTLADQAYAEIAQMKKALTVDSPKLTVKVTIE